MAMAKTPSLKASRRPVSFASCVSICGCMGERV
jgi:hypothetical protein